MSAPDFQPPDTTLFSYTAGGTSVTQGATYDAARGLSITRTDAGGGGASRHGFRGKAVPAGGSWEAIIRMRLPSCASGDYIRRGFSLLESGTGKSVMIGLNMQAGVPNLMVMASANLNVDFSTTILSTGVTGPAPEWWRWTWDGTNLKGFASYDWQATWEQICSFTPTTYFTSMPDKIGVDIQTFNAITIKPYLVVLSYDDPDV